MVKNLQVYSTQKKGIPKNLIHKLVNSLKYDLQFSVSSLMINFVSADQITSINSTIFKS